MIFKTPKLIKKIKYYISKHDNQKGFTLLEVVLSILVVVMIAGVISQTFETVHDSWRYNKGNFDFFQEAEYVSEKLNEDIKIATKIDLAQNAIKLKLDTNGDGSVEKCVMYSLENNMIYYYERNNAYYPSSWESITNSSITSDSIKNVDFYYDIRTRVIKMDLILSNGKSSYELIRKYYFSPK